MEFEIAILIAAISVGLVKGGIGGSLAGAIVLPLLTRHMSVAGAVGVAMPLLIVGDIFAMRFYWREWDAGFIRLLLTGAVPGIICGTLLLVALPDQMLRHMLGITTLAVVLYKVTSDSLGSVNYQPRNWHGRLAGAASGFTSTLANLGGPPITAWLLLQRARPTTFVGTITCFFFVVNLAKLPGYFVARIIDLPLILSIAWVLPVIPPFVWLGRRIIGRINRRLFERAMLLLLAWVGVSLLFSSPVA